MIADLTLLDGGGTGTICVVALLLCRVVSILRARVCRGPLLVAIVTIL